MVAKVCALPIVLIAGQVVSAEILMASEQGCPIEMHRIGIEKCDEMYDPDCKGDTFMPFHRAQYDKNTGQSPNSPREQVRRSSSYLYSKIESGNGKNTTHKK